MFLSHELSLVNKTIKYRILSSCDLLSCVQGFAREMRIIRIDKRITKIFFF
jgi:hypothetical protein